MTHGIQHRRGFSAIKIRNRKTETRFTWANSHGMTFGEGFPLGLGYLWCVLARCGHLFQDVMNPVQIVSPVVKIFKMRGILMSSSGL